MRTLQRIIVGHDLQPGGHLAAQSAMELAERCGAEVKLVHVVEPYAMYQRLTHPLTSTYKTEELVERAGRTLQKLSNDMQSQRSRVEYEVRTGKPFVELIIARRSWQADLLVVGTRQEDRSRFLGSTGERVARKAMAPVLVAKQALNEEPKTIIMPTDFSECAKKAAQEALAFIQHFGGRLIFLHALELPSVYAAGYGPAMGAPPPMPILSPEEIEPEWQAFFADLPALANMNYEHRAVEGHAISMIGETAEKQNADLIIMGTHGRTGLGHMLLGSVAEGVVRQAPCSVLTIRPDAMQFVLP